MLQLGCANQVSWELKKIFNECRMRHPIYLVREIAVSRRSGGALFSPWIQYLQKIITRRTTGT